MEKPSGGFTSTLHAVCDGAPNFASLRTFWCRMNKINLIYSVAVVFMALLVLGGCAAPTEKEASGPIFYPPLPNPPRIQYLTTFSNARDAGDASDFSDFVFGKERGSETLITKPYGTGLYDGKVFGVDTRGPSYVIFDLKLKRARTIYGAGASQMQKPINISFDQDGNRYISDTQRDQILKFDKNDKFVRAYGIKGQFKPTDVLLVDDEMYVVDIAHHKIHVLSASNGRTLRTFGAAGSKAREFYHPTNIKLGKDGNLYISDTGNYRVQVINREGKFIRSIGQAGSGLGSFARPKGIALDNDNNLYVVDAAFNNVQVFRHDGKLLLFFGGPGNDPGGLNLPTDIEIDYENVSLFQKYAAPDFKLDFVILVANQFGLNKISAYGYGKMKGMEYE